ncbi:hypothetical protein ABZ348_03650 [Streptomyces sp. NPDC005963]|uniref:hypothetical protein n=1 Tax=Streptomyces sp. NPDC005963 TaxID=3156721 RepID=UPI0033E50970
MTAPTGHGRTTSALVLYCRSRRLPAALALLVATALLTARAGDWSTGQTRWDQGASAPAIVFAPLLASVVVGSTLPSPGDELDRLSARAWWPRRLVHLLGLTSLAALLLALAVPGAPGDSGAPAAVRNLLGAMGLVTLATTLCGARVSWLPVSVYAVMAFTAAPHARTGGLVVWAWALQPGAASWTWLVAGALFTAGAVLHAGRGARREGP